MCVDRERERERERERFLLCKEDVKKGVRLIQICCRPCSHGLRPTVGESPSFSFLFLIETEFKKKRCGGGDGDGGGGGAPIQIPLNFFCCCCCRRRVCVGLSPFIRTESKE